jgi:predicted dithiol-disulfide oxidoreductase (DUF899 family)
MSLPEVVSRQEWLAARRQLAPEKELTRQHDVLNADRRRLPMVRIDHDYAFDGEEGTTRLDRINPDWQGEGATEVSGFSRFLRDGEAIFHTYSAYARGTEPAAGAYPLLDLTALGRQEAWEKPRARADAIRHADPSFS